MHASCISAAGLVVIVIYDVSEGTYTRLEQCNINSYLVKAESVYQKVLQRPKLSMFEKKSKTYE